jgi:hypothetical protein
MTPRLRSTLPAIVAGLGYALPGAASAAAATCESRVSLALPHTAPLSAQLQPAGRFTPSGTSTATRPIPALANLPAFCRVTASSRRPFFARGGKLLLYHGWNDRLVAPVNTVLQDPEGSDRCAARRAALAA